MRTDIGTMAMLLAALFVVGCDTPGQASRIAQARSTIIPGNTRAQIIEMLGEPGNRSFQGQAEALQYCSTGFSVSDDYLVVWLWQGKVVSLTTYQNRRPGNCSEYFRQVDWSAAPSQIIEMRYR